MSKKIAAVILAAGGSSRMGFPKALLSIGGYTFLEKIYKNIVQVGLNPVRLVAGEHFNLIADRFPELMPIMIKNDKPDLGQLHSLRLGLREIGAECDGVCMFLVDHPLVQMETVALLAGEYEQSGCGIIIPTFQGKRGHPVLFDKSVFAELFTVPLEGGARQVVNSDEKRVAEVAVEDPGVLADIDTRAAYDKYIKEKSGE